MSKEYTRLFTTLGLVPVHGSILLHNNFEHLPFLIASATAGDYIFELNPNLSFSGAQCLHIKTRTTDAAGNDFIKGTIKTHLFPSLRATLTIRFRSPDFTKIAKFFFSLLFNDGTNLHTATVTYIPGTPNWLYYNAAGENPAVPNSGLNLSVDTWHSITLKVDFRTKEYISMAINHLLCSLSGLSVNSNSDGTESSLSCSFRLDAAAALPAELFIDEFTLTEV